MFKLGPNLLMPYSCTQVWYTLCIISSTFALVNFINLTNENQLLIPRFHVTRIECDLCSERTIQLQPVEKVDLLAGYDHSSFKVVQLILVNLFTVSTMCS